MEFTVKFYPVFTHKVHFTNLQFRLYSKALIKYLVIKKHLVDLQSKQNNFTFVFEQHST